MCPQPLCKDLHLHPPSAIAIESDIRAGVLSACAMSSLAHSDTSVKCDKLPGETYFCVLTFASIEHFLSLPVWLFIWSWTVVNSDFPVTFQASVLKLFILPLLTECFKDPHSHGFPPDEGDRGGCLSNIVQQYFCSQQDHRKDQHCHPPWLLLFLLVLNGKSLFQSCKILFTIGKTVLPESVQKLIP